MTLSHPPRQPLRDSRDHSVTGLVQALLRDPGRAAASLEEDLHLGADPVIVLALLSAVERLTQVRGLHLRETIHAIRKRILRRAGLRTLMGTQALETSASG